MTTATAETTRWLCRPCGTEFIDQEGTLPCPRCGNANPQSIEPLDGIEEAAVEKARKVMKPSPVKSAPLTNGKVAEKKTAPGGIVWERVPVVLLGLFILGLWWMAGGKYTIDGMPLLFNEFAAFFRVQLRLAPVTNGVWYAVLCWVPVLISLSERRHSPWFRIRRALAKARQGHTLTVGDILFVVSAALFAWVTLVWVIVSAMDAGSTWLAVTNPPADAYTISKQVAAARPLAGAWTAATTFLPEMGMAALIRWLWE
jgi:hypothetical protein